MRLHRANGRTLDFSWNGVGWQSAVVAGALTRLPDGWTYLNERDVSENYDNGGRLTGLSTGGLVTVVQYDASGRLWRVANPFGRAITFAYDGAGRVGTVTRPDGNTLGYAYDARGNFASVRFADNAARQYVYDNVSFPSALTGVVDESGRRRLTWTYDGAGRPNGGWYGSNVNAVNIQYNAGAVTIADARGATRVRVLTTAGGRPVVSIIQTVATVDSAATGWTINHDGTYPPGCSLVVSPHAKYPNDVFCFEDFIDQPVVDVDSAGVRPREIPDQLLEGWWGLVRVVLQNHYCPVKS